MGQTKGESIKVKFGGSIKLEFHGAIVLKNEYISSTT